MRRTIFIIICIAVVFLLSVKISVYFDNVIDLTPSDRRKDILITSPIKDAEISSPLSIAGRARGKWFFEGIFPVILEDSYGNRIAEGHVSAQGDWMTKDFVTFIGDLEFSNYIKGSEGKLIFKSDTTAFPEENGEIYILPVIFK